MTLATGRFTIAGGRMAKIELHLSPQGRALLARVHVLRARATTVARYADGRTHVSHLVVTIRANASTHARRR